MIRFVEHNDIDTEKWDECIRRAVNSLPYAFSWYLDIAVSRWDALILNDYEAVFPLPFKSKYKINYSSTPFWIQQLGLFSKTYSALERVDEFINLIPKSFRFVELNMNYHSIVGSASSRSLKVNKNYVLQLDKSYEEQSNLYSKNLKRNLKKAASNTIQIFKNDAPKGLINLFRSDRGRFIKHFKDSDYNRLESIMHVAIHKHCGQVWMVYDEGNRALAGMFLLFSPTRITLLFTGNSKEGKENLAMPFLIDAFIKESAKSGLVFDFEGSNDANLARFYKSFGAKDEAYQSLQMNRLPLLLRFLK